MSESQCKLLVVEDNRETQLIVKAHFRNKYTVKTTDNVDEAIKLFLKEDFDLILLDFNLRGDGDGKSLLKKIREGDKNPLIPVIITTAYDLESEDEKFFNDNANAFLPKPINKDTLLQTVENLIGKE